MSNDMQALVAAHFIKDEKLIYSVGVVYDKSDKYSYELAHKFKSLYTKLSGKIKFFDDISTNIGFKRFKDRDKNNIELLFSVADAKQSAKVISLLKKQNPNIKILSTDGLLDNALENERDNLDIFNGIYVVENYAHIEPKTHEHKALKKYLLKYKLEESSYAYLAYDAYQLLYYALDVCVDYDTQCISAAMKNSDIIEGIKGNFSIINSKAKREVYVDKIIDSKLIKEIVIY
jgi:ABC-type branched-subunit amino acid transport system substrate-binding protein